MRYVSEEDREVLNNLIEWMREFTKEKAGLYLQYRYKEEVWILGINLSEIPKSPVVTIGKSSSLAEACNQTRKMIEKDWEEFKAYYIKTKERVDNIMQTVKRSKNHRFN